MNISDLVREAEAVVVLAGAGMSAELGIPIYWGGKDSRYGSSETKYGYTELEHAMAMLWDVDPKAQVNYFKEAYVKMNSLDFANSPYSKLRELVGDKDCFYVTSNVDSAFLKSGFPYDRIFEVHGAYRNSQCLKTASHPLFLTVPNQVPVCPTCGSLARPNVLFFDDFGFNPLDVDLQESRFRKFSNRVKLEEKKTVILEFGVGTTVPTVRMMANRFYKNFPGTPYIHVNLEPRPDMLFSDIHQLDTPELWVQKTAGAALDEWLA